MAKKVDEQEGEVLVSKVVKCGTGCFLSRGRLPASKVVEWGAELMGSKVGKRSGGVPEVGCTLV